MMNDSGYGSGYGSGHGSAYLHEGSLNTVLAKLLEKRRPVVFYLELTVRCNNDCRHCYNNLPAGDGAAKARELTAAELLEIARHAVELGAIYCTVTGGEPLLRPDFPEIYVGLKKLGLLVTVFTNGCLVNPGHVELFRRYPPEHLDITVYGVTRETYERVSRRPGTYAAFRRGLDLLLRNGIPVGLKCTTMRSNVSEITRIAEFCREHSNVPGRYSTALFLRTDGLQERNREILEERLSMREVAEVEESAGRILERDEEESGGLGAVAPSGGEDGLFHCNAGLTSFAVDAGGVFRLCSMLRAPGTGLDLRADPGGVNGHGGIFPGGVAYGWNEMAVRVRATPPGDAVKSHCGGCVLASSCFSCPAFTHLEGQALDGWSEYFCDVTHAMSLAAVSGADGPRPAMPLESGQSS